MQAQINDGCLFVERIARFRCKVGIIYGWSQPSSSNYARQLHQAAGLSYLDVTAELLPVLASRIGEYDHMDFIDYLLSCVRTLQHGLIVDEIEPLIATFGKQKAGAFFKVLLRTEPATSLIVVTHLTNLVQSAGVASANLFSIDQ